MGTSQSRSPQHTPAPREAAQAGPQQAAPQRGNAGVAGTLSGWWDRGTSWVGQKTKQAGEAIGGAWDATKKAATDVKEIWQQSDVGYSDGKITASTDMDEVMDVLPEDLRKKLNLDRSLPSANRVNLEIDRSTGRVTLRIPDLMLSSLDLGGISAGKTRMTGITLSMDGGAGVARDFAEKKVGKTATDMLMGKEAGQSHDAASTLRVQSVHAQDVRHAASKASVRALSLEGLSVQITNRGGGLPGADARPDQLTMDFSVGSATVQGFSSPEAQANSLGVSGLKGRLDQQGEDGAISADAIRAGGLQAGGQQLGSGEVRQLSAKIDNRGGGMPLLDQTPDQLRTSGQVGAAEIHDLKTKTAAVGAGQLQGGHWAQGQDRLSVGASSAGVRDVKGSALSVGAGTGRNLSATFGADGHTVTGDQVRLDGVRGQGASVGSAEADGMRFQSSKDGKTLSADAKRLAVSGVDTQNLDLQHGAAADLRYRQRGDQRTTQAGSLSVEGLRSGDTSVGSARASGIGLSQDQAGTALSAQQLSLQQGQSGGNKVASATASGLALSSRSEGGKTAQAASADALSVTGLDTAKLDAATLSARALRARRDAQGVSASVGHAEATKIDAAGSRAATASISGLDAKIADDRESARLALAQGKVTGLDTAAVDARSLSISGLSAARDGQQLSASARQIDGVGLSAGDNRVAAASLTGLTAQGKSDGTGRVGLDAATLRGVDTASVDAATVTGRGLAASRSGTTLDASARSLGATDVRATAGGAEIGARQIGADNLAVRQGAPGAPIVRRDAGTSAAGIAGLIEDADVRASVGLRPGKMSVVEIEQNTALNARVKIDNGQIDPRATRADFSRPLDGPLWTSVNGVYLDPQRDGSVKAKADVGGFFDQDITKHLPGGNKTLSTDAARLAAQVSPAPARPATTSSASTGLSASAGQVTASGVTVRQQTNSPALSGGGPVDLSRTSASGSASLRSGSASVGAVKADLLREDARDNAVQFGAQQGGRNLALEFTRLLVGSFSTTVGGAEVSAGRSSVQQGQLSVKPQGQAAQVNGSIGEVKVQDLNLRK